MVMHENRIQTLSAKRKIAPVKKEDFTIHESPYKGNAATQPL